MLFEFPRRTGARSCAPSWPLFTAFLLSLSAAGCLVDNADRCGQNQHFDDQQRLCLCDNEYALVGNQCEPCGENEIGSPDGCVCREGFVRPTPDAACQTLAGLGEACKADADCGEAAYGYCRSAEGATKGYCTAPDCQDSGVACPGDYSCNARGARSFCERPPTGLGKSCGSSDDCSGQEASYCETVSAKACVVNDCKPDPSKCYGDWVCCDIGLISQSLCVPPSELDESGNCPAGGTLITAPGGEP
jgi:hypothetical protein